MELLDSASETDALEHVLAFLDEFDCDREVEAGGLQRVDAEACSAHTEIHKRKRRLAAKTRYRGRVKEEYARLRSDVRTLEVVLEALKADPRKGAALGFVRTLAQWHDDGQPGEVKRAVTREYKRRKQAEATNRQLRALLNRVHKAFASSSAAWDKIFSEKNVATVMAQNLPEICTSEIGTSVQRSNLEDSTSAMMSLSARIDRLMLDCDLHFTRAGLTDSNSLEFRTRRVFDQSLGDTFEVTMSSLLPCSKEHGSSLFLRILKGSVTRVQFTQEDHSHVTECNKLMKSVRFGRYQYELEGVAGIRKVIEPTSDSVVWTTLAALPSEVVNFREDCIMNLQGSSPTACHLRIWFQVYAESFSLSPEAHEGLASERLKESVLRSHCRTAADFFQSVEKTLANEVYIPHPCNAFGEQ